MYIHKYVVNDQTIYLVSPKPSKPSKNMVLTAQNWKGYSSGSAVKNAVDFLGDLSFSKEEKAESKPEEKKKKMVAEKVRKIAKSLTSSNGFSIPFSRVKPKKDPLSWS
jgi:hypothetical protein